MSASRFFLFSKVILILVILISLQSCSSEDNTVNQPTTSESNRTDSYVSF